MNFELIKYNERIIIPALKQNAREGNEVHCLLSVNLDTKEIVIHWDERRGIDGLVQTLQQALRGIQDSKNKSTDSKIIKL